MIDHPDKVRITMTRTPMMMVCDRPQLDATANEAVDATIEFKRQHIVTITASEELLFNIEHWMERNVSTGRRERHEWRLDGAPQDVVNRFLSDRSQMLFYRILRRSDLRPWDFEGYEILPPSIVWRYGSDDDVCLLRMRWEGVTA